MEPTVIMAFFSALALGHCVFLAIYFWTPLKKKPSSFFLGLLLITLAIRILKSVLVILIPESPDIIPAFGLIGLAAIGPSLWLYSRSFKNPAFQANNKSLWHYCWALLLIVLIPLMNDSQMYIAYVLSVSHMFCYLLLSAVLLYRRASSFTRLEKNWSMLLICSIFLIWLSFFFQLLIESFTTYLMVTVVATAVIYGLSLWAGKRNRIFLEPKRITSEKLSREMDSIGREVETMLDDQKIYTDSNLTVKRISTSLSRPEYLVSQAINFYFKKSFPELLNEYRVQHASQLIHSSAYDQLSIEGIAYESGYNSISAFYRAFKNIKGITPAKLKRIN